jgi:hypothetical protein
MAGQTDDQRLEWLIFCLQLLVNSMDSLATLQLFVAQNCPNVPTSVTNLLIPQQYFFGSQTTKK